MSSLRQAINAKCRECIFDRHGEGNWKQQVTACSSTRCPLYTVRPTSLSVEKTANLPPESMLESTISGDPIPAYGEVANG